jgi:hypothetical protein
MQGTPAVTQEEETPLSSPRSNGQSAKDAELENAVTMVVHNVANDVARKVCELLNSDDAEQDASRVLEEEQDFVFGTGVREAVKVEEEYTEETEDELRRACQREIRSSVQLQCEVFVEYCTAARTSQRSAVRTMDDRTQVDGFTLQGSTEAYLRRFEALRNELLDQGLLPPDRIKIHSNFECFHLLYTAAAAADDDDDEAPDAHFGEQQTPADAVALDCTTNGIRASVTEMTGTSAPSTQRSVGGVNGTLGGCWQAQPPGGPPSRGWGGKVNTRPAPQYKARSATWGDGTRTLLGNHASTGVGHAHGARHFPRIGSFEVYFRAWPQAPVQLIHSKLLHGKFKSVTEIVYDICIGLRRAAAACELSVWQGTFVAPPLRCSHPPLITHPGPAQHPPASERPGIHAVVAGLEVGHEAAGRGAEAAAEAGAGVRRRRPGSPRHFRRVFGSMQPRTDLHPHYPVPDQPISPRVVSPLPSPQPTRKIQTAAWGDERARWPPAGLDPGLCGSALAGGGAAAAGCTGGGSSQAGKGGRGIGVGKYGDMMRHGLTPPVYLSAHVRAGSGDLTGEPRGVRGAWGLAEMMSSCSHALDAVGTQLQALLTIVESAARAGSLAPPLLRCRCSWRSACPRLASCVVL